MTKLLFSCLAMLWVLTLPAAVKFSDYQPGKTPDAKNLKFKVQGDTLVMDFASGNGVKSRGWMRQYADWMSTGRQLKITIQARTFDVGDSNAQLFLLVQPVDGKNKGVQGKIYSHYVPAKDYFGNWKLV